MFVCLELDCIIYNEKLIIIKEGMTPIFVFGKNKNLYYPFKPRITDTPTFKSSDEILWCYHLNETSSAVLSHDTIYI